MPVLAVGFEREVELANGVIARFEGILAVAVEIVIGCLQMAFGLFQRSDRCMEFRMTFTRFRGCSDREREREEEYREGKE
jgi:hypothetical protein